MNKTLKIILTILSLTPLIAITIPLIVILETAQDNYESEHNTDVG